MIELKNYQIDIAEKFAEYRNNPAVLDNGYDKVPNPFRVKDANEFIAVQLEKKPAWRKLIYWKGQFVGEIGIDIKKDIFRLSAEIGYFIAEPFWGKGIASTAIKLMTDYAFQNFNIIRIEAGVLAFNKPSMRVLEKNDFYLESIKKNAVIKNEKITDAYLWVKLK